MVPNSCNNYRLRRKIYVTKFRCVYLNDPRVTPQERWGSETGPPAEGLRPVFVSRRDVDDHEHLPVALTHTHHRIHHKAGIGPECWTGHPMTDEMADRWAIRLRHRNICVLFDCFVPLIVVVKLAEQPNLRTKIGAFTKRTQPRRYHALLLFRKKRTDRLWLSKWVSLQLRNGM